MPGAEALRQLQAPTGVRHRGRQPPRRCALTARRSACWTSWWARPARRPTRLRQRSRRARRRRRRCWSRRAPSGQCPPAGGVRVRVNLRARPPRVPPARVTPRADVRPRPCQRRGRSAPGPHAQHARAAALSKGPAAAALPAKWVMAGGWGAPAGARGAGGQARHPRVLRRRGRPRGGGRAAPARERRAHPAVCRPVRCADAHARARSSQQRPHPMGLSPRACLIFGPAANLTECTCNSHACSHSLLLLRGKALASCAPARPLDPKQPAAASPGHHVACVRKLCMADHTPHNDANNGMVASPPVPHTFGGTWSLRMQCPSLGPGASIAIDDCYELWESGFISIPFDFQARARAGGSGAPARPPALACRAMLTRPAPVLFPHTCAIWDSRQA